MAFPMLEPEIDISVSKLLGFKTFANSFRVLVSVSKNLVLEKKSWFRFQEFAFEKSLGFSFRKFGLGKKVSVSVLENLVSKELSFGKFGLKKVSILVSGFRKLYLRKEKIKMTRKNLHQVNSANLISILIFFCFVPIYKMEESKDCSFNIDILFRRRKKRGKILGEG